jgi:hypothetical protein
MHSSQIVEFVRNIPNGRIIGITWVKADGSVRSGKCSFGVKNPSNSTPPGQGIRKGVDFKESVAKGVLKFFDTTATNRNGTLGDYRSARLDRIIKISYNGEHIIEDNQHLID